MRADVESDAPNASPSLFRSLRHSWWVVAAIVILAVGVSLVISASQSRRYTATARALLDPTSQSKLFGDSAAQRVDPLRRLQNEVTRMSSPPVIQKAMELAANVPGVGSLASHMKATAAPDQDLIKVSVSSPRGKDAADLANAVVSAYQQVVVATATTDLNKSIQQLTAYKQQIAQQIQAEDTQLFAIRNTVQNAVTRILFIPSQIAAEVDRRLAADPTYEQVSQQRQTNQTNLDTVQAQIDQANINLSVLTSGVDVVTPATVPTTPTQPKPVRNAALAILLGLLAGSGLAYWRADRQGPVDPRRFQQELGVPQFGALPPKRALADGAREVDLSPRSEIAAVGRMIATAMGHRMGDQPGRRVLVTSLRGREGRTITALTAGIAAARAGRTVVVVDADGATRGLTHATNADGVPGLSELLSMQASIDEILYRVPMEDVGRLWLIPAGQGDLDSTAVAASDGADPLWRVTQRMDLTLIDGPPLLVSPEALELAGAVDWVLLVVTRDVSAADLDEARQRLQLVNANLIGFVANDRHPGRRDLRVHGMRGLGEVPVAALTRGAPPPEPDVEPAELPTMASPRPEFAAPVAPPVDERAAPGPTRAQAPEGVPVAAVPPPVPEDGVPYSPYPRPDPVPRYEQPTQAQPVVLDEPPPRPRFSPGDVVPPVGTVVGRRPDGNGADETRPAPTRTAAQPPPPPGPEAATPPPPPRVEAAPAPPAPPPPPVAPAPPPPAAAAAEPEAVDAPVDAPPEADAAPGDQGMPEPPAPGQTLMGLVFSFGEPDRRPPS